MNDSELRWLRLDDEERWHLSFGTGVGLCGETASGVEERPLSDAPPTPRCQTCKLLITTQLGLTWEGTA
jgi:hypothetical protein